VEIKEKLKQEEELLVKVFKLEKFIKKYKKQVIAFVVIVVVGLIGGSVYNYIQTQKLIASNNAFDTLLLNPNDKEALEKVKQNEKLYQLYLLQTDNPENLQKITAPELKAIAAYKEAMLKGDKKSLENYLLNPDYKILKDPVRVALMRIYLKEGNRKKAQELYMQISPNSEFATIGKFLLHYGIAK
jgi:predicted negative regulator of RcsB-dependent stress response